MIRRRRKASVIFVLWLLSSMMVVFTATSTTGFVIPTQQRQHYYYDTTTLEAESSNKGQQQQQQQKRKSRRFGQDVHNSNATGAKRKSSSSTTMNRKSSTNRRTNNTNANDTSLTTPNKRKKPQSPQQSVRPPQQSQSQQSQGENKDYMWKTGKSIEDLESSMTKRWGDAPAFIADPREYDDDNEEESNSSSNVHPKSRAVYDPWQKEEYLKRQQQQETQPDALLERVKRNQKRFGGKVAEQEKEETTTTTATTTTEEFYDEDDEGYEIANTDDTDDAVGKLLAPQPVGGKGFSFGDSFAAFDDDTADTGGGYFLNPNAMKEEISKEEEVDSLSRKKQKKKKKKEEEKKKKEEDEKNKLELELLEKKKKRPRRNSIPFLDDSGNPTYLTLEQAQTNFQVTLMENNNDDDDNDDNDDTLQEDEEEVLEEDEPEEAVLAWNDLGITSPKLLENLESVGCSLPLNVQEKCCPPILTGNDVLVGTYTGSGKTLAFLVPLIQGLLLHEDTTKLRIIIVAPGRELASQITQVARSLLKDTPALKVVMAIGGTTFTRNVSELRKKKPAIVVGTPGRIAELVVGEPGSKGGRMKVSDVKSIVLDEFDALLQYKAHREPTKALFSFLRNRHRDSLQSIMCSATATDMMISGTVNKDVYKDYLRGGDRVSTVLADEKDKFVTKSGKATTRVSRTVIHGVMHVPRRQLVLDTIRRILHTEPMPQQVLIFCDSSRDVELLVQRLAEIDIIAAPLHGNDHKNDRAEVSQALRSGYVGLVVSTELAARGLDAPLLTHVINVDLPTDASHYAHRAGRCGRGGRPGVVLNLTANSQERKVPKKFTDALGVDLYTVRAHGGKLQLVVDDDDDEEEKEGKM